MIFLALFCVKDVVVLFNIKFIAGLAFQINLLQGRTFAQVHCCKKLCYTSLQKGFETGISHVNCQCFRPTVRDNCHIV